MAKQKLDSLDKRILQMISKDARVPFLEIARECNVSGAAIHQRVQKLKGSKIVLGSEFIVNTYKVGYQTCAFVGINLLNTEKSASVISSLEQIPEIVECHYSTGKYAMFVKILAKDNRHLLHIIIDKISKINGVANTETFQMSLEEVFRRQLSVFDADED
ncbi:MAG: Lrp/AsnC ligand binding domain-containing protein [Prevotellaceae bacterium]|jgi:Lrp/AsnC family transcriptional regulator for asnA, asnC and gidA|nr:Lrp/AsnC ligand binding domain-containing protein [Prevotellaceae bacterium]